MKIKSKLLILFCIVLTFSLSACSSDKNSQTANAPSKSSAAKPTASPTASPSEEETEVVDNSISYDISPDGVLTIRGNGPMPMYDYDFKGTGNTSDAPWFSSRDSINKIVLTGNITYISPFAFGEFKKVREVEFCDSIKAIDRCAFMGCSSLSSVTLPKNCTEIRQSAFKRCVSLKSVTLPDNIEIIASSSFDSCTSLESIVIPDGISEIGESAFYNCKRLSKITIPASVKKMNYGNFKFSDDITICAPIGSYAESFAKEYKIKFEPLN